MKQLSLLTPRKLENSAWWYFQSQVYYFELKGNPQKLTKCNYNFNKQLLKPNRLQGQVSEINTAWFQLQKTTELRLQMFQKTLNGSFCTRKSPLQYMYTCSSPHCEFYG